MSKKLKLIKIIISVIFILFLLPVVILNLVRFNIVNKNNYSFLNNEANKVLLFIGDGMGENHIKVSETALDKNLIFSCFDKQGYVSTFSNKIFGPTDSAAAGTALATGRKVNNGEIAYHNNQSISSISEEAKDLGYGVGIITTDNLSGATPSAFSSHAKNRKDEQTIIEGQIISNIDLFLGAGLSTYKNYQQKLEENEYEFITTQEDLKISKNKLFGVFTKINNYNSFNDTPRLIDLVEFAIKYFEYNYPNGYFIMIEGAHIDKMSHDNNINEMIDYLDEFNNAIEKAYNMLNNQQNICIIVTADHETGGLKYTNNKNEIDDHLYTRTGHSSKKVRYFIYSKSNKVAKIKNKIDNTDIYKICKALLTC